MTYTGTQPRLNKRRRDFYDAMMKGSTLREAVATFAERYHVSKKALYMDWQHHAEWQCVPGLDVTTAVQDSVNRIDEVKSMLWDKALNAVSDRDQINAMFKIADIEFRSIAMLQSLGVVKLVEAEQPITHAQIDALYELVVAAAGPNLRDQKDLMRKMMAMKAQLPAAHFELDESLY
jgi:hypothetical protein